MLKIQKPVHNNQTQDQSVRASFKSLENQSKQNQCKAWNFQYTLHTYLLGEEGVTTYQKNESAYRAPPK